MLSDTIIIFSCKQGSSACSKHLTLATHNQCRQQVRGAGATYLLPHSLLFKCYILWPKKKENIKLTQMTYMVAYDVC